MISYLENNSMFFNQDYILNYFGSYVPNALDFPISLPSLSFYLLSNTEAMFDTNLIGFEIYAYTSGTIEIHVN